MTRGITAKAAEPDIEELEPEVSGAEEDVGEKSPAVPANASVIPANAGTRNAIRPESTPTSRGDLESGPRRNDGAGYTPTLLDEAAGTADSDAAVDPDSDAGTLDAGQSNGTGSDAAAAAVDDENGVDAPNSGSDVGGDTRSSAARSLTRLRPAVLMAVSSALVLVTLSVAAILLAMAHHSTDKASDRDLALLGAVRQDVVNLISPSVKDPAGSADRIVKDATGQWLTEFQSTKDRFVGAINDSKTDSVGEILGAGIERRNGDGSTTVLVSAVSKVTNAAGAKDDPRTWRLRIDVVENDGAYKLSKVEVVP